MYFSLFLLFVCCFPALVFSPSPTFSTNHLFPLSCQLSLSLQAKKGSNKKKQGSNGSKAKKPAKQQQNGQNKKKTKNNNTEGSRKKQNKTAASNGGSVVKVRQGTKKTTKQTKAAKAQQNRQVAQVQARRNRRQANTTAKRNVVVGIFFSQCAKLAHHQTQPKQPNNNGPTRYSQSNRVCACVCMCVCLLALSGLLRFLACSCHWFTAGKWCEANSTHQESNQKEWVGFYTCSML